MSPGRHPGLLPYLRRDLLLEAGHLPHLLSYPVSAETNCLRLATPASFLFIFIHSCLCVLMQVDDLTSQFFSPDLFLYVNLVTNGAQKLFKTLAPSIQQWLSLTFADAYSHTLHPIDLNNLRWFLGTSGMPLLHLRTVPVPKRISQCYSG